MIKGLNLLKKTQELYIDSDRQCYNALQHRTLSYFQMARCMVSFKWMQAIQMVFTYFGF
jgi:hypothetical protein